MESPKKKPNGDVVVTILMASNYLNGIPLTGLAAGTDWGKT